MPSKRDENKQDLILIKPSDVLDRSSTSFSEKIISSIMSDGQIDVVGLGTSIFLACSAVNISTDIANVHIHEVTLDYIEFPFLGKSEVIIFTLKNAPRGKHTQVMAKELNEKMKLTTERDGQLIVISRRQTIERTVQMCLWKLINFERIKLMAGGSAINNAIRTALVLAKGNISKQPLFIELISLEKFYRSRGDQTKPITGIHIYIKKGKEKESSKHKKLLASIKSQIQVPNL